MATIKVLDQESNPLSGVSIVVFDSLGKRLGGIITNSKGEGNIPDNYLSDKNGEIRVSLVEYNPSVVKVSDFRGIVYLGKKEKTLGEVIIVRKKQPQITIKNPFETAEPTPTSEVKKKSILPKVIGGGILLGLLSLVTIKAIK